jgi:uncharacterized phage-associated protein
MNKMNKMNKIKKFEYIVNILLKEYSTITWKTLNEVKWWDNDLSILKIQKLLFFISTKSKKLLNIFEFYALPYWPVEIDTYKEYSTLENINITTRNTEINIESELDEEDFKTTLNQSILDLKKENPSIFKLGAFDLVNISHKWACWKDNKDCRWLIAVDDILFSITYYK